jgi:choline dehydrogenase
MITGRRDDPADRPHLGVALMQPRSRGRVGLASGDPETSPIIEHHYDREPDDVAALRAGRSLRANWLSRQRKSVTTRGRRRSTCPAPRRWGLDGNPTAVVDERCRVRGVEGLWVVDGSVLPSITSRGPHATIVMIGHRAAEFIA